MHMLTMFENILNSIDICFISKWPIICCLVTVLNPRGMLGIFRKVGSFTIMIQRIF